MKVNEITWKDIQDILSIDERIMFERIAKTGRMRALSQRHCREVLREFKIHKEDK